MRIPRVMLAAPKSGSGKTVTTCALLQLYQEQKKRVAAFKCGPDYIDPMFHQKVIGVASQNLDSFFVEEKMLQTLFADACQKQETELALIEGVMGLFDGISGIYEEGSSYHIASILQTPIVLIVDVHGMARSLLPLLAGFLQYDHAHIIKGVILNRTTKSFCDMVRPLIEKELSIKVLGFVPKKETFQLESRHLGLQLPYERKQLHEQVKAAAAILSETIDTKALLNLAETADAWELETCVGRSFLQAKGKTVKIGIAMDEAFCFYYEQNLRLLETLGAELVPFSPLHDEILPDDICGMILGGGYPELFAEALSKNQRMRNAVREKLTQGMPSLAECGGFMYLHEKIADASGKVFDLVGMIPGKVFDTGRLVRFGYIEVKEKNPCFLPEGESIKGHEFHYFDSEANGEQCIASKPRTKRSWDCVQEGKNHWWGFSHLYYLSNPAFVVHFIEEAENYKKWEQTS